MFLDGLAILFSYLLHGMISNSLRYDRMDVLALLIANSDSLPMISVWARISSNGYFTSKTWLGESLPFCHILVIVLRAGRVDSTMVPLDDWTSSSVGSSHISSPTTAYRGMMKKTFLVGDEDVLQNTIQLNRISLCLRPQVLRWRLQMRRRYNPRCRPLQLC